MALTTQLIGTIGGGGKPAATTITGSGTLTRTAGESGKMYLVTAATLTGHSTSPTVTVSGVVVSEGTDATASKSQGMIVAAGPVAVTYKGSSSSHAATIVVTETVLL